MPSEALNYWRNVRLPELDEIEAAHRGVGGTGPGRRFTTLQVNYAYALLLCSQFQGFCRNLHTQSAEALVRGITPDHRRQYLYNALTEQRKLDRGNPTSGNLGSDFGRLGIQFWPVVHLRDVRNEGRQARLDQLNRWRNAIAHHDFDPGFPGGPTLRLDQVRDWRSACDLLAGSFDEVMAEYLESVLGVPPW